MQLESVARTDGTNVVLRPEDLQASEQPGLTLPERILDIVLRHRRLIPEHQHLANAPTRACRNPHVAEVERAVCARKPIHFILPAFPCKSSSPEKTFGPEPDMGERLALGFLQSLCDQIREIYPPGARVSICSDGRVFSDLVLVKEENVALYKRELAQMIEDIGASSVDYFDLDDAFPGEDYGVMREELLLGFGTPLRELRERVRAGDPDTRTMFNGIHRFMVEDYAALLPGMSRNRQRILTKVIAYRVIQRSNAWSRFVESRFAHSLRLSIHPQRSDSRKIGIALVPCEDVWGTPWHNVVVFYNGKPRLLKRRQAEALGAELVLANGRPSHYVMNEAPATVPPASGEFLIASES